MGGREGYDRNKGLMTHVKSDFEPKLFEISNTSGYMWMKPIPAFNQQSLMNCDVYLLDAWNRVFVWIGKKSNKFEYRAAYKKLDIYIGALHDGRTKDTIEIVELQPGQETPYFKL